MPNITHLSRVRTLYKLILRLHRGLPPEIQPLGDQYVRDEFKMHKNCETSFVPIFMSEWTNYAITLAKQLGKRTKAHSIGEDISKDQIQHLNDSQVEQLLKLFQETQEFRPAHSTSSVSGEPGTS